METAFIVLYFVGVLTSAIVFWDYIKTKGYDRDMTASSITLLVSSVFWPLFWLFTFLIYLAQ